MHKVHFLLASLGAKSLTDIVIEEAAQRALVWDLAELKNRFESKARYDDPDTAFIKHMLSEIIPQGARESILASAFGKEIGPEREFAESLYASESQLKELWLSGMVVGGHSGTHPKLGMCPASEQRRQIGQSAALLTSLGVPAPWHFSYPYGHNSESTPPLLEAAGFVTAVTTRPVRITQSYDDPMHLCRVDTNDLPTNGDALVAPLTEQALAGV